MARRDDEIMVQNADPVPMASGDMSLAQIDDIARRATAMATTLATDAGAQSDTGNEAKVAGEVAVDVAGGGLLKLGSMAVEVLDDRMDPAKTSLSTPTAGKTDGIIGGLVQTMDEMMIGSARGGEELLMSANIAESSLLGQDKNSIGTWAVNNAKVDGVSMAKRLTFDKVYANQHALDSVPIARAQYASTMHSAFQMAPGMAPRPNLKPTEMLQAAEDYDEEMSRWRDRGGEGVWS